MSRYVTRSRPLFELALAFLALFGLGAAFHFFTAPSEFSSATALRTPASEARFVFADLDGDRKPDLALVEMQSELSDKAHYSIRLQLSQGRESAIGVLAPFGGLRIAARDVNGDDNVDLIVTSILDTHFIQVLLNDGRGNFSMAPPEDFPQLENESQEFVSSPIELIVDRATLVSARSLFGEGVPLGYAYDQGCALDSCPWAKDQPALHRVAHLRLGRAPPFLVSL
jgi:hypothetical protein